MAPDRALCPACSGPLRDWRWVASSEPALAGRRWLLRRCADCGTAVTVGGADVELHETGAYRPGTPRLHSLAQPVLARFDRRRLSILSGAAPPPARLLDVGAGRGRFVLSAALRGYDARGIEPSERGSRAAAAAGASVARAGVEDAELAPASFEAASVWHVLEHLEQPGDALERIREWLVPRGALLVGVPNLASLQARLGGTRWYHLDVPRHRVHFTSEGIERLLRAHGFDLVRTYHVLLEHNPFGLWQTGVNAFTRQPSYLYNLLKHNARLDARDLAVTAAALPLAPAAAALELLAGLLGHGGTVAVLALKRAG